MKIEFLFILIIVILNKKIVSYEFEDYFCNSESDLLDFKSLLRIYFHDDKIYVAVKDKIIFFDSIQFIDNEDHKNSPSIILKRPTCFKATQIEASQKLFGYAYDYVTKDTFEFRFNKTLTGLHYIFSIFFDVPRFGTRRVLDLDFDYLHFKDTIWNTQISPNIDYYYFFTFKTDKNKFLEFKSFFNENSETKISLQARFCTYDDLNRTNCWTVHEKLEERTKFLIAFLTDGHDEIDKKDVTFVRIDQKNQILIERKIYLNNFTEIHPIKMKPISFGELFSCKFEEGDVLREIKGIFYEISTKTFFIFKNRLYKKFKIDLIESEFKLVFAPESYEIMKFNNSNVEFEIANTKWVKTLQKTSFLITSKNNVFDLNAKAIENGFIKIDQINLAECSKQTLNIGDDVFCFEQTEYYYLTNLKSLKNSSNDQNKKNKKFYKIETIFNGTEINYDNSEMLELIFNYESNKFVFLTRKQLFVFDYDKFLVVKKNDKMDKFLFANYSKDQTVMIKKNCLFEISLCDSPTTVMTEITKYSDNLTSSTGRSELYQIITDIEQFIIIGTATLLLVLIVIIFCLLRTNEKLQKELAEQSISLKSTGPKRSLENVLELNYLKKSDSSISDTKKPDELNLKYKTQEFNVNSLSNELLRSKTGSSSEIVNRDEMKSNEIRKKGNKIDEIKVNESKIDEIKIKESKTDKVKVEGSKTDEAKVDGIKKNESKTNESKITESKTNESKMGK